MKTEEMLRERMEALARRWVEETLTTYSEDAAALFARERDPFANPVGESVRKGTRGLLDAVLGEMDPEEIHQHLDHLVRVRAVQQFPPSRALAFVFSLKPILRDVLPEAAQDSSLRKGLAELDTRIDRVALMAFDHYSACREEVSQLRINEAKRRVAWILEKINQRDGVSNETSASPD